MTGRAAATGIPWPDQYLRPASPAPHEQPDKDIEILVFAAPDRSAATTTRRHEGAVQSG
nr:hypothetical protein [Kibdelosporangium sp. MJ126-NF4]CTQ96944.1 hypothetical protein [Kibdelosporangium sp. MJ126-NF4]